MSPSELQAYLHLHIPLSQAMQVTVREASTQRVVLAAPLGPNINHRHTVFGGSVSAVAILAAWSVLHVRLDAGGLPSRVVIQRNTLDYERPIDGDFTATAEAPGEDAWQAFTRTLQRRGRARIAVAAVVEHGGATAGRLDGVFVAFFN